MLLQLGRNANSLALGCDCLGFIHYFDGILTDAAGDAKVIKNAICMHEEDDGACMIDVSAHALICNSCFNRALSQVCRGSTRIGGTVMWKLGVPAD